MPPSCVSLHFLSPAYPQCFVPPHSSLCNLDKGARHHHHHHYHHHHDYHYHLQVKTHVLKIKSFIHVHANYHAQAHKYSTCVHAECVRCFFSPFVVEMRGGESWMGLSGRRT